MVPVQRLAVPAWVLSSLPLHRATNKLTDISFQRHNNIKYYDPYFHIIPVTDLTEA